jgi:hypothetical protein
MNMHIPHRPRPITIAHRPINVSSRAFLHTSVGFDGARRLPILLAFLVASLLLTACGSNSGGNGGAVKEDRQFASNATSSKPNKPTVLPTETNAAKIAQAPTASAASSLKVRGAPSISYIFTDNRILAFESGTPGAAPIAIQIPAGERLLDYDASPDGDRVAVATASDVVQSNGSYETSLTIWSHDGKQVGEPRMLFPITEQVASPVDQSATATVTIPPAPLVSLAWSDQGDQILVSSAEGMVVTVPVSGNPQPITINRFAGQILSASWSPRGGTLLLVVRDVKTHGSIALVSPKDHSGTLETIWPRSDEAHLKSVESAQWMPDGSGIMFTQSELHDGAPVEAQLFELSLVGKEPVVIATPGRAGPSAAISFFVVSPDGKSVAYTISRPTGDGWSFNSLWVRSIRGEGLYSVPVPSSVRAVSDLRWSSAGLIWQQSSVDGTGAPFNEVVLAGQDGATGILATSGGSASPSPDAATPMASPKALPDVSRDPSPKASPIT